MAETSIMGEYAAGMDITALLREHFDLAADRLELLDLGADAEAKVYRIFAAQDQHSYFLKTRPYSPHLPGVEIPAYLAQHGIPHIPVPILTKDKKPVFRHENTSFVLYPFLSGGDAMQKGMSLRQWTELGTVMKAVHSTVLPEQMAAFLPRERFSPEYRRKAEYFMRRILAGEMREQPGAAVAETLHAHRNQISHLISQAEMLGQKLAARPDIRLTICHADLHKWNLFITDAGDWYVIDWDSLKLAPKECDLMYIGGNIGGDRGDPNEAAGFFAGYGGGDIDKEMIDYYRFERIAVDIAEFCKQVWNQPAASREECLKIAAWLDGNFRAGGEFETACGVNRRFKVT